MVENEAMLQLRETVRRAIYRHIATRPTHRLDFKHWHETTALNVELPEAAPILTEWAPGTADAHVRITRSEVACTDNLLIVDGSIPVIEQSAFLALSDSEIFEGRLVTPEPKMAGYSWYDRLAHVTAIAFDIERDGEIMRYSDADFSGLESGPVAAATLVIILAEPSGDTTAAIPAPFVIEYDDGSFWGVEDANILVADPEAVNADSIVALLEGICFSPSDELAVRTIPITDHGPCNVAHSLREPFRHEIKLALKSSPTLGVSDHERFGEGDE
jgi:hypothetical protein